MKTVIIEAVDAVLVVVASSTPPPSPPRIGRLRIAAWLVAAALAAPAGANFAYIRLLQRRPSASPTIEFEDGPDRPDLRSPGPSSALCVQPAIVEELFFRYLAIGHLRTIVGTHGAVWIAAVMFGVAHLFNPLGVPYLIVAGFVFGYARVLGRGLASDALHFAHNAAVSGRTWI